MQNVIDKSGVFYFKKRIPTKLIKAGAYPGKTFIEFSLGKHTSRAQAKRLAIQALAKCEQEFKEKEAELFPAEMRTVMLNKLEIDRLVDEWEHYRLADLDQFRRFAYANENQKDSLGRTAVSQHREFLESLLGNMRRQKSMEDLKSIQIAIPDFLEKYACVTVVGDKQLHDQLAIRLQDAEIRLLSLAIRKLAGDLIPDAELPPKPLYVKETSLSSVSGKVATIDRLFQLWKDENRNRPSIKTVASYARSVKDWQVFCNKDAADILRTDVLAWVQHLAEKELSIITVGNKLLHMSVLFNVGLLHARELNLIENPFKAVSPAGVKLPDVVAWKISHLTSILNKLPNWKNKNLGEAGQWIVLLCYATGMRLEEASQLMLSDIFLEQGRYCIRIRGEVDFRQAADGSWPTHHLKNEGSRRRIPIHLDLIDAGFIKYFEMCTIRSKGDPNVRLFPLLRRDKMGILSSAFSKLFGIWAKLLGVKGKVEGQVFHSFRHLFKDLCRIAGITNSDSMVYLGHSDGTVSEQYGALDYPLEPLCLLIDAIRFPIPLPIIIK